MKKKILATLVVIVVFGTLIAGLAVFWSSLKNGGFMLNAMPGMISGGSDMENLNASAMMDHMSDMAGDHTGTTGGGSGLNGLTELLLIIYEVLATVTVALLTLLVITALMLIVLLPIGLVLVVLLIAALALVAYSLDRGWI